MNIKLLLTLQNKLTLSSNEKSLTQSEREKLNVLINITIVNEKTFSQNKRELLKNLILIFQLVNVQIVISEKNTRHVEKIL